MSAGDPASPPRPPASVLRRLVRLYFLPQLGLVAAGVLAGVIAAAGTSALPLLVERLSRDFFNPAAPAALAVFIPAAILGLMLLRSAAIFVSNLTMGYAGRYMVANIQKDLFARIIHADYAWAARTHSGKIISSFMNDANRLEATISTSIAAFARHLLTLAGLIAVMIWYDWRLTLILLAVLPVLLFLIRHLGGRVRRETGSSLAGSGRFSAQIAEMFRGLRIVKAYLGEPREIEAARRRVDEVTRHSRRSIRATVAASPAIEALGGLGIAAILFYGGAQVRGGLLTQHDFVAFLTALLLAQPPARVLADTYAVFQQGVAAARRVFALLDAEPRIVSPPGAPALAVRRGGICFDRVAFAYHHDLPALKGVSFEIPAGSSAALVGPSGAGKSTILNLLPRFYDAGQGAITIDGQDIRAVTLESLRGQIALVTQEPILFDDTIYANIAYGRPGAATPDVEAAARAAAAHDFITALPQGYQTRIGEDGLRLSGGERQRIALARAALRAAPILLLDEPTSALDSESERQIQNALVTLLAGRTSLIIAHRLATIRHVDCIHVIDKGRIVESGSHEDLLTRCGLYARLCEAQLLGQTGAG